MFNYQIAMYKYKIFESFDNELEIIWKKTELDKDKIFDTFDWHKSWHKNIGRLNGRALIIVIEDLSNDSFKKIIFPLIIKKYFFFTILEWSGYPFSDLNSPISNKKINQSDIDYFLQILKILKKTHEINIFIAINQINVDFIKVITKTKNFKLLNTSCHYFYNFKKEDFELRKIKNLKYVIKDIQRQKRRFEEEISFINNPKDEKLKIKIFNKLIKFKYDQYDRNKSWNYLKYTNYIEFLSSQINNQNIHLSALLVEDKIIAVHMGYLYKKNFFYILPAYDYNYKKLSVGNILLLELFENFKQNLNTFDFTIGEEIYKAKWTNNKNQAYDFIFYTDLKGFIFYIFMLSKKIIKKSNFLTKNIKFIYHFFKK